MGQTIFLTSVKIPGVYVHDVADDARVLWPASLWPSTTRLAASGRPSAQSICFGLSEMRRAIIDCIDDDEDLRDLSRVSRVWYQDVANGPAYQNILRRLLNEPGCPNRLAPLPASYSYLGVVLLLRQVQNDPHVFASSHPDMLWLRDFLGEHYPSMLVYFARYSSSMQGALWQWRREWLTTTAAHGLTALAYGMSLAVLFGSVALACSEQSASDKPLLKFAPLLVAPATVYAAHAAAADLSNLIPEKSGLPALFDHQKQALQYALRPRSLSGLPAPA